MTDRVIFDLRTEQLVAVPDDLGTNYETRERLFGQCQWHTHDKPRDAADPAFNRGRRTIPTRSGPLVIDKLIPSMSRALEIPLYALLDEIQPKDDNEKDFVAGLRRNLFRLAMVLKEANYDVGKRERRQTPDQLAQDINTRLALLPDRGVDFDDDLPTNYVMTRKLFEIKDLVSDLANLFGRPNVVYVYNLSKESVHFLHEFFEDKTYERVYGRSLVNGPLAENQTDCFGMRPTAVAYAYGSVCGYRADMDYLTGQLKRRAVHRAVYARDYPCGRTGDSLRDRDPVNDSGIAADAMVYICCGQDLDHPGCLIDVYSESDSGSVSYRVPVDGLDFSAYGLSRADFRDLWMSSRRRGTAFLDQALYDRLHNEIVGLMEVLSSPLFAAYAAIRNTPGDVASVLAFFSSLTNDNLNTLIALYSKVARYNEYRCNAKYSQLPRRRGEWIAYLGKKLLTTAVLQANTIDDQAMLQAFARLKEIYDPADSEEDTYSEKGLESETFSSHPRKVAVAPVVAPGPAPKPRRAPKKKITAPKAKAAAAPAKGGGAPAVPPAVGGGGGGGGGAAPPPAATTTTPSTTGPASGVTPAPASTTPSAPASTTTAAPSAPAPASGTGGGAASTSTPTPPAPPAFRADLPVFTDRDFPKERIFLDPRKDNEPLVKAIIDYDNVLLAVGGIVVTLGLRRAEVWNEIGTIEGKYAEAEPIVQDMVRMATLLKDRDADLIAFADANKETQKPRELALVFVDAESALRDTIEPDDILVAGVTLRELKARAIGTRAFLDQAILLEAELARFVDAFKDQAVLTASFSVPTWRNDASRAGVFRDIDQAYASIENRRGAYATALNGVKTDAALWENITRILVNLPMRGAAAPAAPPAAPAVAPPAAQPDEKKVIVPKVADKGVFNEDAVNALNALKIGFANFGNETDRTFWSADGKFDFEYANQNYVAPLAAFLLGKDGTVPEEVAAIRARNENIAVSNSGYFGAFSPELTGSPVPPMFKLLFQTYKYESVLTGVPGNEMNPALAASVAKSDSPNPTASLYLVKEWLPEAPAVNPDQVAKRALVFKPRSDKKDEKPFIDKAGKAWAAFINLVIIGSEIERTKVSNRDTLLQDKRIQGSLDTINKLRDNRTDIQDFINFTTVAASIDQSAALGDDNLMNAERAQLLSSEKIGLLLKETEPNQLVIPVDKEEIKMAAITSNIEERLRHIESKQFYATPDKQRYSVARLNKNLIMPLVYAYPHVLVRLGKDSVGMSGGAGNIKTVIAAMKDREWAQMGLVQLEKKGLTIARLTELGFFTRVCDYDEKRQECDYNLMLTEGLNERVSGPGRTYIGRKTYAEVTSLLHGWAEIARMFSLILAGRAPKSKTNAVDESVFDLVRIQFDELFPRPEPLVESSVKDTSEDTESIGIADWE